MIVQTFETEAEWLEARLGKLTGSRAGDAIPKRDGTRKKGFYELIAERTCIPGDAENPMDRGHRLEKEAIERFTTETGMNVDTTLKIWSRDDNASIAVSPDGSIGKTKAVEVKCLNSANHIEAFLTNEIPEEYTSQKIQYFVVNDQLKELYFVFYDPRMLYKDFFYITVKRKDIKTDIEKYLTCERETTQAVEEIVKRLSF